MNEVQLEKWNQCRKEIRELLVYDNQVNRDSEALWRLFCKVTGFTKYQIPDELKEFLNNEYIIKITNLWNLPNMGLCPSTEQINGYITLCDNIAALAYN